MLILPPAPTGTIARFDRVWPAPKVIVDVGGSGDPVGYSVTNPDEVGAVIVVLTTTAETPVAGTPPSPVTCKPLTSPGPRAPGPGVLPESRIRAGGRGLKSP